MSVVIPCRAGGRGLVSDVRRVGYAESHGELLKISVALFPFSQWFSV